MELLYTYTDTNKNTKKFKRFAQDEERYKRNKGKYVNEIKESWRLTMKVNI